MQDAASTAVRSRTWMQFCIHGRRHRPRSRRHRRRVWASASWRRARPRAIARQPSAAAQITGAVQPAALPARRRRDSRRGVLPADRLCLKVGHGQPAGPARSRALHLDHRDVPRPGGAAGEVRLAAAARRRSRAGRRRLRKSLDDAQQAQAGARAPAAGVGARCSPGARRRPRPSSRRSRTDAEALREELKQKARAEAAAIVKNAERQIQHGDRARAAADSPRGRRSVGDDRVEDPPAQRVEGRQRAPDRRDVQAGRSRSPACDPTSSRRCGELRASVSAVEPCAVGAFEPPAPSSAVFVTAPHRSVAWSSSPTPCGARASPRSSTASGGSAGVSLAILALAGLRFAPPRAVLAAVHAARAPACRSARRFSAFLAGDAIGSVTPLGLLASEPTKVFLTRHHLATRESVASLAIDNLVYAASVVAMVAVGVVVVLATVPLPMSWRMEIVGALALASLERRWSSRSGCCAARGQRSRGLGPRGASVSPVCGWPSLGFSEGHPERLWRVFALELVVPRARGAGGVPDAPVAAGRSEPDAGAGDRVRGAEPRHDRRVQVRAVPRRRGRGAVGRAGADAGGESGGRRDAGRRAEGEESVLERQSGWRLSPRTPPEQAAPRRSDRPGTAPAHRR